MLAKLGHSTRVFINLREVLKTRLEFDSAIEGLIVNYLLDHVGF